MDCGKHITGIAHREDKSEAKDKRFDISSTFHLKRTYMNGVRNT